MDNQKEKRYYRRVNCFLIPWYIEAEPCYFRIGSLETYPRENNGGKVWWQNINIDWKLWYYSSQLLFWICFPIFYKFWNCSLKYIETSTGTTLANSVKHKNRGKEGYHRKTVGELFLKTDIFLKIQNASFAFLAVQLNRWPCYSLTHSVRDFWFQRLQWQ